MDGDGANSPYTAALAQTLTERASASATCSGSAHQVLPNGQQQRPWDSSSLTGRFYFKQPDATQTASLQQAPAAAADGAWRQRGLG